MDLKYGNSHIDIELPEHIDWHVLQQDVPFSFSEETDVVQNGIETLIQQLSPRIKKENSLLLIVPDHTRKCNLPVILAPLIARLEHNFHAHIEILIANGSHVQQPESVIIDLVSSDIYNRIPTFQHNSLDEDQLVHLGTTSFGTDVRLNRKVKEADFIITIGGILYHYFAGFGGGPKMLLPGVAGYETIRQNHSRTVTSAGLFHPQAKNGNIETNPVYLDLKEVLNFVPNVLSLQVALSPTGKIAFCKAGPILEVQKSLLAKVREFYAITVKEKADIVVASAGGFPSDVNLIQTHKSIHHAFQVLKTNGDLFICAECREGIGSKTFLPYFEHGANIGKELVDDFKINGQTALALKEKAEQSSIYFISQLEDEIVERIGMIPCTSFADAMKKADIHKHKKGYVMPQANITVPITI